MFILTTKAGLINANKTARIYLQEVKGTYSAIMASFGLYEDNGKDMKITLEPFGADELYVARDVFDQLTFSMDGASNNKIINLAEISKRAKYEYQTGKQYTE